MSPHLFDAFFFPLFAHNPIGSQCAHYGSGVFGELTPLHIPSVDGIFSLFIGPDALLVTGLKSHIGDL